MQIFFKFDNLMAIITVILHFEVKKIVIYVLFGEFCNL